MQPKYDDLRKLTLVALQDLKRVTAQRDDLLAACEAFVEAWEKSLQLEKTDVALRMAKAAIAAVRVPETKGD